MVMIDFERYSHASVDEAKKILKEYAPFQYFKTYFDWQNMLLTDYRETECYNAIAVLKNYTGNFVVFQNCNCGYGGTGPNNTVTILEMLNIPRSEAENFVFNNSAVELYFDSNGNIKPNETRLISTFESREVSSPLTQINLHNIDYCDSKTRTMYLIEPHQHEIFTLLQLFQIMKPTHLSYYIGNDHTKYLELPSFPARLKKRIWKGQSFVYVKGQAFDVVCLFSKAIAKSFINNISFIFDFEVPFHEVNIGKLSLLCRFGPKDTDNIFDKLFAIVHELKDHDEIYVQQEIQGE